MIPFISRAAQSEQAAWLERLNQAMPDEEVVLFDVLTEEQKQDCDVAIVANPDPKDLLTLPNLIWVHSLWAGVERMVAELDNPSFKIVRLVDPELAKTMSEAVLAWTLFLHRDMPAYARQQDEGVWQQRPMVRAQERRVSVLGLGELGKVSALRLKENGFTVSGWSRSEKRIDGIECFSDENGLSEVLAQSDILVCLLPLTAQTAGLLNAKTLAILPENASIINFARGAIIDDEALLGALEQNISHAVLDVFAQEPLSGAHPYWSHPKVTVLPHISAPTHPQSASQIVANNIQHYRETGNIPAIVDMSRGY